jgi:hypothetical protein
VACRGRASGDSVLWAGKRTLNGALTQQRIATFFWTSDQQHVDPYPLLEAALRSPTPMVLALTALVAGP